MKPMSIKFRLTLLVSLLTLAIILILSLVAYVETKESLLRSVDTILRATGNAIVASFEEGDSWEERVNDFRSVMGNPNAGDFAWCRIWADGSEKDMFSIGLSSYPRRSSLQKRLSEKEPEAGETALFSMTAMVDHDSEYPFRVLWIRRVAGQQTINVLVGRSSHQIHQELVEFCQLLLVVGASLMALAFLVTPMLVSWGLRPIARASAQLRKITHKSLKQDRENHATAPELSPFVAALDDMLTRLDDAMRRQRQFIADAAHELRTPVAIVKSTLQTTSLQPRTATEYEESIEETLQDIGRLERLIEQLLSLASLEESDQRNKLSDVHLGALLAETVGMFEARAAQRGSRILFPNPPAIRLKGDEGQLRQLFGNLIDNALRHGPAGGTIRVSLEHGPNNHVSVSVHDEGGRIPPEALAQLFDRFYRVDSSRAQASGGSGLGLAIAREIAHRHKGDIEITSNDQDGTRVVVRLPMT